MQYICKYLRAADWDDDSDQSDRYRGEPGDRSDANQKSKEDNGRCEDRIPALGVQGRADKG